MSSNGQYQVFVSSGGGNTAGMYISTNFGGSPTLISGTDTFKSISISSSGQYIIAINSTNVYTSIYSGSGIPTFQSTLLATTTASFCSISGNGKYQLISDSNYCYVSANSSDLYIGGQVGIGTICSNAIMDISGNSDGFNNLVLRTGLNSATPNYISVKTYDNNSSLFMTTCIGGNNYSGFTQNGDSLICYGDGLGIGGTNSAMGLVIGPNNSMNGGMRMDASGNANFSGNANLLFNPFLNPFVRVSSPAYTGSLPFLTAISYDGKYQLAVNNSGNSSSTPLYSTNYGNTWTQKTIDSSNGFNNEFIGCAISASGKCQIVAEATNNKVWVSGDYGSTWSLTTTSTYNLIACAVSPDGTYFIALVNNNGTIYPYYADTQVSYSFILTLGSSTTISYISTLVSCALSSFGSYQAFSVYSGRVYVKTPIRLNTLTNTDALWKSCAMSYDGKYSVFVSSGTPGTPNNTATSCISISNNYGASLTNTITTPNVVYQSVSISSSGQYIFAVSTNSFYVSTNFGSTFNSISTSISPYYGSISGNGSYRLIVDGSYCYVSTNTSTLYLGGKIGISTTPEYNAIMDIGGTSDGFNNFVLRTGAYTTTPNYISVKTYDSNSAIFMTTSVLNGTSKINSIIQNGDSLICFGDGAISNGTNASMGLVIGPNHPSYGGIRINYNGAVTAAVSAPSDYRIKEQVIELDESFQIDKLRPVHYYNKMIQKEELGFIAHEVQEQYPFLVSGVKDGKEMQALNYIAIIPILVRETKSLKTDVRELKEEIQKQQKIIDQLVQSNLDLLREIQRVSRTIPHSKCS
jgi:hypothetical protein